MPCGLGSRVRARLGCDERRTITASSLGVASPAEAKLPRVIYSHTDGGHAATAVARVSRKLSARPRGRSRLCRDVRDGSPGAPPRLSGRAAGGSAPPRGDSRFGGPPARARDVSRTLLTMRLRRRGPRSPGLHPPNHRELPWDGANTPLHVTTPSAAPLAYAHGIGSSTAFYQAAPCRTPVLSPDEGLAAVAGRSTRWSTTRCSSPCGGAPWPALVSTAVSANFFDAFGVRPLLVLPLPRTTCRAPRRADPSYDTGKGYRAIRASRQTSHDDRVPSRGVPRHAQYPRNESSCQRRLSFRNGPAGRIRARRGAEPVFGRLRPDSPAAQKDWRDPSGSIPAYPDAYPKSDGYSTLRSLRSD